MKNPHARTCLLLAFLSVGKAWGYEAIQLQNLVAETQDRLLVEDNKHGDAEANLEKDRLLLAGVLRGGPGIPVRKVKEARFLVESGEKKVDELFQSVAVERA